MSDPSSKAGPDTRPETEVVSPFASLGQFKAKADVVELPVDTKKLQQDIDQVAAANGFHSRDAKPAAPAKAKRRRFGASEPKAQLNIKAPPAEVERFYRMAEERGIRVLGDLLTSALDALEAADRKKK